MGTLLDTILPLKWFRETPTYTPDIPVIEPDPIVATVMKRMSERSKVGMEKYGCSMMREDIDSIGWIDHTIEELLDAAVYLERLKVDLNDRRE